MTTTYNEFPIVAKQILELSALETDSTDLLPAQKTDGRNHSIPVGAFATAAQGAKADTALQSITAAMIAAVVSALAAKTTPVDADIFAIVDSVSGNLQKLTLSNIKSTLKTYFDTLYIAISSPPTITAAMIAAIFSALTTKTTPVDADIFAIVDSVSGDLQKLSFSNLKATLKTYFDALYVSSSSVRTESLIVTLSPEADYAIALTTGVKKTIRFPYAFTLTDVRASLAGISSSGNPTVDIKKNGTSILSTLLSIDAGEKTSLTAAVPAVLSTTAIASDDEIEFSVSVAGTGALELVVALIGHQ